MNKDYTGLNPTPAMRAYLDEYGILHAFGLNTDGELNYNGDRATKRTRENFANSVDITQFELFQEQGYVMPAGKTKGKGLAVYRDDSNAIVCREEVDVPLKLQEVYKLAENAYKA
jgi:hypothetical protein